jgi:hypothetical protein
MYQPPPHPHRPPAQDEAASFAPTIIVNAACIGLVVVSLLCFLLMARLLIATTGTTGGLLAVGHGVVGLAALAGAIGVRSGRVALAVIGLLACPIAGAASLFALVTGSIAGLVGGGVTLVTLVVTAISLGDVMRMGAARKALRSGMPIEVAPPSGPLSGDMPRVKARRWPVVVVLVGVVGLVAGGAVVGTRLVARSERLQQANAFRSLETCLLGGPPPPGVPPSVAYRRMEISLVAAPPSANPWPARCATHAHALHESKRHAAEGENNTKDVRDTAFWAERLGHVLADARGASVYDTIEQLWRAAEKESFEKVAGEAGATPPANALDVDALARVEPFSKNRMQLSVLRTDWVQAPTVHLLVDGSHHGDGRLCTMGARETSIRCKTLPPPLDQSALRLIAGAEADTPPLLFAGNNGDAGIFRTDGTPVAETWSYGGIARADGSIGLLSYDKRASKYVLLRSDKGSEPTRTPFAIKDAKGFTATIDDNVVWMTDKGSISVARMLPAGAPLGATTELGTVDDSGRIESIDGCRSADAFFLLVRGSVGSSLAIDSGDRWSSLIPVKTEGTLTCSGKEAFITQQSVRSGGTGAVSIERCSSAGCQTAAVDLDDVFQQNTELLPKLAPMAFALDEKLLLVWRAGQRGGVRMRLAPVDHIAAAEDIVLFDDRIANGRVTERSSFLDLRGWARQGRAVLLLGTNAGVWAIGVEASGRVTPIETVR